MRSGSTRENLFDSGFVSFLKQLLTGGELLRRTIFAHAVAKDGVLDIRTCPIAHHVIRAVHVLEHFELPLEQ